MVCISEQKFNWSKSVYHSQSNNAPVLNLHQLWDNRGTNVSFAGPFAWLESKFPGISTVPPCGLRFFGKSLKSDELNRIPGLKLTNGPSVEV